MSHRITIGLSAAVAVGLSALPLQSQTGREGIDPEAFFAETDALVDSRAELAQQIVDKLFSFSELGMQEFETQRYLVSLLREHGFRVEEGVAGMPSSWWATWGSGDPVIALGSDIDGIPKASQMPGVAYHQPMVEGAPGHGEGHNSGQAVNIVAALAVKEIMEREGIPGTIVLWPGVAEEQLASKAWFVRDGLFADVDATIFTHVGSNLSVSWGSTNGTGLVSAEFTFEGEAAHSAGAPQRGRSALDAVELMNAGWNFYREHTRDTQRSHYVITDGGDQPNVVPSRASVWYFIRELDQPNIQANFEQLKRIAEGAALMTNTTMSYRILGTAYPRHFNKPIAETVWRHIKAVGLPKWSEADQALAIATQLELGSDPNGLATSIADSLSGPPSQPRSGGSDDIGDISWTVPTVTVNYPSNIPGLPGHHWANAISMATPIAHKGVVAGAKVVARSTLELFARPDLVEEARTYFTEVQGASHTYTPFIGPDDPPPTHLNREIMAEFGDALRPFHYDEDRYDSYLEQLGIEYPTLREDQWARVREVLAEKAAEEANGP